MASQQLSEASVLVPDKTTLFSIISKNYKDNVFLAALIYLDFDVVEEMEESFNFHENSTNDDPTKFKR
jgi:hypothetical protein